MASLSLVFDLLARDKASPEFRKVGDAAEQAGKRSEGFGGSVKKAMGIAAGAIAAVGVGKLAGDFIGLAADAEQSMGGVEAVFKGYADTVKSRSKEAATALGLSANSYRELATVIGSQLKNAGVPMEELGVSTDKLIGQGADLAAMFGGTTQEAVDALSSALKGEMDPIEKYGISLNDAALKAEAMSLGLYSGKGNLDANAKSMAVMSLVTKQGADSIGAFGREADTAAGKQQRAAAQFENMKTALGEKLLPIFANVMGFIAETAIPALGRLGSVIGDKVVPIFKEITGGIFAFAAAWKYNDGEVTSSGFPGFMERVGYAARQAFDYVRETVIPALADFAGWVKRNADIILPFVAALGAGYVVFQTITAITKAWAAAQLALNAVMAANPIGLVIVAIAALVAGLVVAYQRSETFREIVDKAFRVVAEAGRWMWETVLKPVFGFLLDYWTAVAKGIGWAWENVIQPAWGALVAYVKFMWDNVVRPYLGFIADAWSKLASGLGWVYDNVIAPVWGAFQRGLEGLQNVFQTVKDGIGRIWDGLVDAVKKPIRVTFEFVNDKMIGPINTLLGKFPGNLSIPSLPRLASGGLVRGPGTGTSDSVLGIDPRSGLPTAWVSDGEMVVNAEATKRNRNLLEAINSGTIGTYRRGGEVGGPWDVVKGAVGWAGDKLSDAAGWVAEMATKGARFVAGKVLGPLASAAKGLTPNNIIGNVLDGAIDRLVNAVLGKSDEYDKSGGEGGPLGSGPAGSSWASLWNKVKAQFPTARMTSNYRAGDPGYHGKGKALDVAGARPGDAAAMLAINRWAASTMGANLSQLIYTPGVNLLNGRPHTYNAATRADHYDHVHMATYDSGGILPPGLTVAYNGTGRNETIRTAEQERALGRSGVAINVTANFTERDIARAIEAKLQQREALAPAW